MKKIILFFCGFMGVVYADNNPSPVNGTSNIVTANNESSPSQSVASAESVPVSNSSHNGGNGAATIASAAIMGAATVAGAAISANAINQSNQSPEQVVINPPQNNNDNNQRQWNNNQANQPNDNNQRRWDSSSSQNDTSSLNQNPDQQSIDNKIEQDKGNLSQDSLDSQETKHHRWGKRDQNDDANIGKTAKVLRKVKRVPKI